MTKYPRLESLNKNLFPPISGGWKSNVKVPAGLISPEATLRGCSWPPSLCVLTCLFPGVFSYKNTSYKGLGSHLLTSFDLNYSFKDPIQVQSHSKITAFNICICVCAGRHNSVHNNFHLVINSHVALLLSDFLFQ